MVKSQTLPLLTLQLSISAFNTLESIVQYYHIISTGSSLFRKKNIPDEMQIPESRTYIFLGRRT